MILRKTREQVDAVARRREQRRALRKAAFLAELESSEQRRQSVSARLATLKVEAEVLADLARGGST